MYVLRCDATGRFYTGQTSDLEARLARHNDRTRRGRDYTARGPGSWRLVYHEEVPTRRAARQREKWLKSGVGRDWLRRQLAEREDAGC